MLIKSVVGQSAYSSFYLKKLTSSLQFHLPMISNVQATKIYWVALEETLSEANNLRLLSLLEGTWCQGRQHKDALTQYLYTMPRLGTISPWSSKATDICQACDVEGLLRVEKGIEYKLQATQPLPLDWRERVHVLYDQMLEICQDELESASQLFMRAARRSSYQTIDIQTRGFARLQALNDQMELTLSSVEIEYLLAYCQSNQKLLTDAELMMFAQVNSEHCRHKLFKSQWQIDGEMQTGSLFESIKSTYQQNHQSILSAYVDNAAIIKGFELDILSRDMNTKRYQTKRKQIDILMKVETHNHPTAISPYPGAATGVGGEIRDEAAVGIGGCSKAGLSGYCVSNLYIPGEKMPWELTAHKPKHFASSLLVMLEAPIGASQYANEFGRPNITGYFRTFEIPDKLDETMRWGYHKPIMIVGGVGQVSRQHIHKKPLHRNDCIIQLGGPAFLIGLGGGSASSSSAGHNAALDFASVQRGNAEMERRAQEVINSCCDLEEQNPIISIHDVGAGGLSNAIPELVYNSGKGAKIDLSAIPTADPSLSPLELWCNEAQERYVLVISPNDLLQFEAICKREACPFAKIGEVTDEKVLQVYDPIEKNYPICFSLETLFGIESRDLKVLQRIEPEQLSFDYSNVSLEEAIERVLQLPTVGDKSFLITIGDRTVTGLVARDQLVGPWQVPVADCGVTAASFDGYHGEALAMGERPVTAIFSPKASCRMALGEVITNLAAADISNLSDIKLSANWMVASQDPEQALALYDAVTELSDSLCKELGLTIPVGKDSVFMQTTWDENGQTWKVKSPMTVNLTGFAPVKDVKKTLTPELSTQDKTVLIYIDLAEGKMRLGGSAFLQVYNEIGTLTPNLESPELIKNFFKIIRILSRAGKILAYHDRSDGGLFVTLCEMAFASHMGLHINISEIGEDPKAILFNEELGAVIQVEEAEAESILTHLKEKGLKGYIIGYPKHDHFITFVDSRNTLFSQHRTKLQKSWSTTSFAIRRLRDNVRCVQSEYDLMFDEDDPGLIAEADFEFQQAPAIISHKPTIAILREQGTNGQTEMAAAFHVAGFECLDLHTNDLLQKPNLLAACQGMAVCGGFSYGDVLGAGRAWAKKILFNEQLSECFRDFFHRTDTITLAVCNGCQMLAHIKALIPGTEHWPIFSGNISEQFEARLSLVEIQESASIFFQNMAGAKLPIVVSHREGQAKFSDEGSAEKLIANQLVTMRYIDGRGRKTVVYPANPNGSPLGVTGLTNEDGRVAIMMPHPERVFKTFQLSWRPKGWGDYSPWFKIFTNARLWLNN